MADWRCPQCSWVNRDFADACLSCGQERPLGAETVAAAPLPDPGRWDLQAPFATPMPTQMDPSPANETANVMAPPAEPYGITGLSTGIVGALIAAVLASAIWYAIVALSSFQIGYVAAAVGWLVGTGAVIGARGRGSIWLSAASVIITVLALGISEYLIAYHWATRDLGITFSLLQPPDVMLDIVLAVLQEDPATLLFWAFAVALAAYVPFKAIYRTASVVPAER